MHIICQHKLDCQEQNSLSYYQYFQYLLSDTTPMEKDVDRVRKHSQYWYEEHEKEC